MYATLRPRQQLSSAKIISKRTVVAPRAHASWFRSILLDLGVSHYRQVEVDGQRPAKSRNWDRSHTRRVCRAELCRAHRYTPSSGTSVLMCHKACGEVRDVEATYAAGWLIVASESHTLSHFVASKVIPAGLGFPPFP